MGFKARKKENDNRRIRRSYFLTRINEERWENDLPEISHEDYWRRQAEYMDEHYGYDIGK